LALVWAAKDAILFPFVWRSYDTWGGNRRPSIGSQGVAETSLSPSGYIRLHGELWRAELAEGKEPISKGETVEVKAIQGLTLFVEPLPGKGSRKETQ
jgi:membrane-bound serine protease (ClpP class)